MKNSLWIILLCIISCTNPQNNISDNTLIQTKSINYQNLMYSLETMQKLQPIVDSLHTEFHNTIFENEHYADSQAIAHFIRFNKNDKNIQKALSEHTPFEDIIRLFGDSLKVEKNRIAIIHNPNYRNNSPPKYYIINANNVRKRRIAIKLKTRDSARKVKGKWIFKDDAAAYFTTEFTRPKLPKRYAQMINYWHYMVDDSSKTSLKNNFFHRSKQLDTFPARKIFLDSILAIQLPNTFTFKKNPSSTTISLEEWKNHTVPKESYILGNIAPNPAFQARAIAAYKEALHNGYSDVILEKALAVFYSREKSNFIKSRIKEPQIRCMKGVFDQNNPYTMRKIELAKLAAEASECKLFIKHHLNLLRANRKKMYLQPLDKLGVSTHNLILNKIFKFKLKRKNSPSSKAWFRYMTSCLLSTQHPQKAKQWLVFSLLDNELDNYNRLKVYRLMERYIETCRNETAKTRYSAQLNALMHKLPACIKD